MVLELTAPCDAPAVEWARSPPGSDLVGAAACFTSVSMVVVAGGLGSVLHPVPQGLGVCAILGLAFLGADREGRKRSKGASRWRPLPVSAGALPVSKKIATTLRIRAVRSGLSMRQLQSRTRSAVDSSLPGCEHSDTTARGNLSAVLHFQ